jgi:hypothetical protein
MKRLKNRLDYYIGLEGGRNDEANANKAGNKIQ